MNTNDQAAQLRLAADIIETDHPFEYQSPLGVWMPAQLQGVTIQTHPQQFLAYGIRLVLATPPDSRPLHNPDNLTAEQVGAGYRLTLGEEEWCKAQQYWSKRDQEWRRSEWFFRANSFRVPLSTPWPEVEKPDPYAKLKAAHKAGKVIQTRVKLPSYEWGDEPKPLLDGTTEYRIKPEEPAFQLPPPPHGMQWHREDAWKADDLPPGYRPLIDGEVIREGDEFDASSRGPWETASSGGLAFSVGDEIEASAVKFRTTRPLIFQHARQSWTWHKPGDPMPCDGESKPSVFFIDGGESFGGRTPAKHWRWDQQGNNTIIGWRYAETTKEVELGPMDFPPGSALRLSTWEAGVHVMPSVWRSGVSFAIRGQVDQFTYTVLKRDGWKINRSISTGLWNPTAWEPCHKTITIEQL